MAAWSRWSDGTRNWLGHGIEVRIALLFLNHPIISAPILTCLCFLYYSDDDDDSKAVPSKHKKKTANAKTSALKAELKELLAQPLVARGVSTRYITSGSRSIVDDVMAGQCMFHFPSLFFSSLVVDWPLYELYRPRRYAWLEEKSSRDGFGRSEEKVQVEEGKRGVWGVAWYWNRVVVVGQIFEHADAIRWLLAHPNDAYMPQTDPQKRPFSTLRSTAFRSIPHHLHSPLHSHRSHPVYVWLGYLRE